MKNVTIPLIKGEMKAKAVGEGMLQVARRGESGFDAGLLLVSLIPWSSGIR